MADFLLTVGVDTSLSYAQMQSDITGIITRLNSNPARIQVQFDERALTTMRRQVEDIRSSLNNIGAVPGNIGNIRAGGRQGNAAAQQYRDAAKAIREYYAALTQLNKSRSDVTLTNAGWQSASGNYNELAATLNRTKTAFDLVSNSMHSMPVAQQVQLQALLTSETNKYNMAVEQQANKERVAAEAAAERARRQQEAADAAARNARTDELLTVGSERQAIALQKVNALLSQVRLNSVKWTAAEGGKSDAAFQTYKRQAIALEGLVRQLKAGTITSAQFASQYRAIKGTITETSTAIKMAGENTQSWGDKLGKLTTRLATYVGMTRVIMAAVRTFKQMWSATIEIDSAMAQLKIVTGATDAQMEAFLTKATGLAKELGQSISDVSKSIETFSRLGYNLGDASELAKYATILSNVAAVDTDTATTGLTSIIKGYNMDVSEAEHVSDVLTKVGQEYAISAEELMAAFQRGGAALYASGTDFEKSAALFAATNASLQNAESVGTMWKTVSARIRGATTELAEMGEETDGLADGLSKYREEIKALSGVDIMKDENTYKDMYDIFVELASVWDNMKSDEARSRVAEILGGTRQLSGIMSTITNIKDAMGAYSSAMDSAGAATKANDIYMETAQAHINQFKTAFQELSTTLIDGSFVKSFADIGKNILEFVTGIVKIVDALGGLKTVLIALTGMSIAKHLYGMIGIFTGIGGSISSFVLRVKELPMAFRIARSEGKGLSSALDLVGISATTAQLAIGAITAAITIGIAAYSHYRQSIEQQRKAALEAAQTSAQEADNIMDLYSAYQTANEAYKSNSGSKEALTQSTDELLSALGYEKDEIDELVSKYGSLDDAINNVTLDALTKAASDAKSGFNAAYDNLQDSFGNGSDWGANVAKYFGMGDGGNILSWMEESEELNKKIGNLFKDAGIVGEGMFGTTGGTMMIETDNVDEVLASYDKLIKAREILQDNLSDEEYNDSGAVDVIEGKITDFESTISEYLDARKLLNESLAKKDIFEALTKDGIPETSADLQKLKEDLISAAEGGDRFSGSAEDISNAFDTAMGELGTEIPGLSEIMNQSADEVSAVSDKYALASGQITQSVSKATEATKSMIAGISAAQDAVNSQKTGKSVSLADFSSEELTEYRGALEYVNGTMQLNADKVREIAQAKADEQVAINNTNKALEQTKYLENAKKIEEYRQKLRDASFAEGETKESVQASIDALLSENNAIADTCAQYDLLSSSIQEAVGSYQHWLNAQGASDYGDMATDAVSAIQRIRDTYDKNSEIFGNFGSKKFDAALDFIVPESVDSEDLSAIESYMADFKKYLIFDDKGVVEGLNIDKFLESSVKAGLMTVDEASGEYKVAGGKVMEDFADGLNMSSGMVQAFFDELQLKGAEFDWSDEAVKTIGDLAIEANEAAEALRGIEGYEDLAIKMDVSDLSTTEEQLSALDATIAEMDGVKAEFGVDSSEAEHANAVIQYCLTQKQLLTQPDVMRVDTSKVEGDVGNAISLLQQFQTAQNDLEIKSKIGADTTDAQAKVDSLTQEIQNLNPEIKAKLGNLDTTSVDAIKQSIQNLSAETINVKANVDASAITGYQPETKQCDVIYNPKTDALPTSFDAITRTVNYAAITSGLPTSFSTITRYVHYVKTGDIQVNGTAHAGGTARAGGDWGTAPGGQTLVGELGREIVVDPHTGQWYTVGDNGAEFRNIPAGAIVFNHKQTESLLANGYVAGRASALVGGTAMVRGGYKPYHPNSGSTSRPPSSSNNNSSRNNNSNNNKKSNDEKDNREIIDWIEIAINRIERAISNLATAATSPFKTLATRLQATNDELVKVSDEIALQRQAEQRYLQEAQSVGLSADLQKRVQNGAIDINEYDSDTAEKIKDYQKWYEASLDCADAIEELKENMAELYENKFNDIATDYENQLSLLEHLTTTYDNGIKDLEERGYLASTKYYAAMQEVERQNLQVQKKELASLIKAMSEGVNSGAIKEGSEAWYEFQQDINAVKESIQETETSIISLANSIREVEWEHFDYLQEQISNITEEADFLIDLMDNSKLYTDNGQLTDTGQATMGLHGQNYNVYMAQADKYAEEIKKLNEEIANDPNNTKLLERREELLEAQRDSILAAEDEKQAIVDMVEEGINLELQSLRDLIDAYNDSLDSAKDLYDYQKKVKDQTSEVARLQKQLSAYANDTSEENRATIQKIQVDLAEAMEDLEETQYDRYINEQKKLLDNLYDEYEMILNQRLDNVEALISDMIDRINANSSSISDTITAESEKVGYDLSESIQSIWSNEGGATSIITKYGEAFNTTLTSVKTVLDSIHLKISDMIGESDEQAKDTVDNSSPTTDVDKNVKPPATTTPPPAKPNPTPPAKQITVGGKINAGSARIYANSSGGGGGRQYFRNDPIYVVLGENNGYYKVRYHKLSSGVTGWFKKGDVKAYKTGGLVDYTGLAQLDGTPNKPELVLNSKDTENFIALKDALRNIADGKMQIAGSEDNSHFNIFDHLSKIDTPNSVRPTTIGDITYEVNIPIEHVSDYNDFMNQMRKDGKFEKFIQSVTVDRMVGGSKLSKNKFKW